MTGVYPAAGKDTWVAVTVQGDAEWAALVALIGHGELDGLVVGVLRAVGCDDGQIDDLLARGVIADRPPPP